MVRFQPMAIICLTHSELLGLAFRSKKFLEHQENLSLCLVGARKNKDKEEQGQAL